MTDIKTRIEGQVFVLAADAIIIMDSKLVLIKRRFEPFKGSWALPGGIVKMEETLEEAVVREVKEETGIDCEAERLVGVFSSLQRDPRARSVAACYKCKAKNRPVDSSEEVEEVRLFPLDKLPRLAFDHEDMVSTFLRPARV